MLSKKYIGRTEEDKMNTWLETNYQGKETEFLKLASLGKPMSGKPAPLASTVDSRVQYFSGDTPHCPLIIWFSKVNFTSDSSFSNISYLGSFHGRLSQCKIILLLEVAILLPSFASSLYQLQHLCEPCERGFSSHQITENYSLFLMD